MTEQILEEVKDYIYQYVENKCVWHNKECYYYNRRRTHVISNLMIKALYDLKSTNSTRLTEAIAEEYNKILDAKLKQYKNKISTIRSSPDYWILKKGRNDKWKRSDFSNVLIRTILYKLSPTFISAKQIGSKALLAKGIRTVYIIKLTTKGRELHDALVKAEEPHNGKRIRYVT